MKEKAKAGGAIPQQRELSETRRMPSLGSHPQSVFLPVCTLCGHRIAMMDEAQMLLSGQWLPNTDLQEPVFVLEVDAPLKFVQLPNGQFALLSEGDGKLMQVVQHMHEDCFDRLRVEARGFLEFDEIHREMFDDR